MRAQLPNELLHVIFEDLPQQTLRDVPLVNPQWNAVSTPLVFERIHTSLLSWSLAKLSALSQSPLAKHVKAIDFHTKRLRDLGRRTFQQYRENTNLPFLFGYNRLTSTEVEMLESSDEPGPNRYTPNQIRKGWKTFRTCLDEQDPELDLLEYGPLLKDCLHKFRNLREVVADRVRQSGTSRIDARVYWNNLESKILVNPLSRTTSDISKKFDTGSASSDDDYAWRDDGLAPTFFLLEALGYRSGIAGIRSVESLTIEMSSTAYRQILERSQETLRSGAFGLMDAAEGEPRYQLIVDIFVKLKHLILLIPGPHDRKSGINAAALREMKLILETAINLQSLELEIHGNDYPPLCNVFFNEEVIGWLLSRRKTMFPHLRGLKLRARFPPKSFINFLSQHRSTLRTVEMRDCESYNWREILAFIEQGLELEKFHAKFLWTSKFMSISTHRSWSWNDPWASAVFDETLNKMVDVSDQEMVDRIPQYGTRKWIIQQGQYKGWDHYHDDDDSADEAKWTRLFADM